MGDDLDDLAVGMPRRTDGLELGLAHRAHMVDESAGEGQRGLRLGIGGAAHAVGVHLLIVEADLPADRGEGGHAVLAGVLLRDRQGDPLAGHRIQQTRPRDPVNAQEGLQRVRRVRQHADEVRDHSESALHGIQ